MLPSRVGQGEAGAMNGFDMDGRGVRCCKHHRCSFRGGGEVLVRASHLQAWRHGGPPTSRHWGTLEGMATQTARACRRALGDRQHAHVAGP